MEGGIFWGLNPRASTLLQSYIPSSDTFALKIRVWVSQQSFKEKIVT